MLCSDTEETDCTEGKKCAIFSSGGSALRRMKPKAYPIRVRRESVPLSAGTARLDARNQFYHRFLLRLLLNSRVFFKIRAVSRREFALQHDDHGGKLN